MRVSESPISGKPVETKGKNVSHVARIEGNLSRVFRHNGYAGSTNRNPLSDLIAREDEAGLVENEDLALRFEREKADAEQEVIRVQILQKLLRYIFHDGPHPGHVMRRVYAAARAYDAELIAEMNGTDLAIIFNEGRAAQSARVNLMFRDYLKKAGAKGVKLPFQKLAGSSAKYAAAAKGNQNRKGKKVARLARELKHKS